MSLDKPTLCVIVFAQTYSETCPNTGNVIEKVCYSFAQQQQRLQNKTKTKDLIKKIGSRKSN